MIKDFSEITDASPRYQSLNERNLTDSERHQILVEWNQTQADYPKYKCIHQLFEEQVERSPDAVAVVFQGEQLTYQELNTKANQFAHYLQSLGVEREVLVGICIERSLEMVVGLLGILKAGGAYVPLDPTYPIERLAFILKDSSVRVLLTSAQQQKKLPQHSQHIVYLDQDWSEIAQHSEENPTSEVVPNNLVYAIYTSGSTGDPKGVLIEHRGLLNLVKWHQRTFAVSPTDRATQLASPAFDASAWELWPYLTTGASIYIVNEETRVFPQLLQDWLLENAITICFLPTPLAESILRLDWPREVALRILLTGGDKLHDYPLPSIPFELVNNYGPTENTVVTTSCSIPSGQQTDTAPPIGRPIANTQVYVLDADRKPVPIGVSGELYIGGDGLGRGYLNRPDLTAEKFIPNTFSNQPGSRLYKTGDLARYLADGNIEFLGRVDNQVKIRGFRIELEEIEAALLQHPNVRNAVVIVREDLPGNKRLVAYVVVQPQSYMKPTPENECYTEHISRWLTQDEDICSEIPTDQNQLILLLGKFLQKKLPNYMVPAWFVMLEALPLTPNVKVDRRALPEPEFRPELELSFVAPRTPVEEILANIWADVLVLKQVGIYDNFFELGGHSLLATQVISRVRNAFSVEIPLRSLFEAPTIAQLQEYIQAALTSEQSTLTPPLLPIPRPAQIPLSFAQARLWFLDQLQPENPFYNIPLVLRLNGQLNIAALESSINEIIRRHESLRTNFTVEEGQPFQIVATTLNLQLVVVDLANLLACEQENETQRLVTKLAVQHFDLEREPLLKANVLKLSSTEYVFVLVLHHIIADGWSLGVLERELAKCYEAFCHGNTPVLPELPIQYADFALWQRNWLTGEVLQTQLNYWQQQLNGILTLLELPLDRPRPAIQSYKGAHLSIPLSAQLSQELASLSKRMGVTLFITLLAAFQTLLYRYTGSDDIVVGTPIANRNRQEIEGLIGFFVNTLVLRTDLSGNPSFEQLLGRVREVNLGAYAHQDLPFEELVEALQPERSLSHSPLFQVMFTLENTPAYCLDLHELTVSSLPVETPTAKFDLTLSMQDTANGLIGVWEYNTDLFDADTIARMALHLQTILEAIVANPKAQISKLPLLTEAERQQLLVEWNNTTTEYPQNKCIHQLFEAQVELTPNAVAVVFEGKQLTYRQLNVKANQLAHYLQALGVEPETLVGIYVERSLEMVVGLLGILKAGGVYVPLDPAYPIERLAFMLEDSRVSVLLTDKQQLSKLPPSEARVVYLDQDWSEIAQYSSENPYSKVAPNNLVYAIYTSGSTGNPKGVLIEHRGLLNLVKWHQRTFAVLPADRATQLAAPAFDACVWELWSYLTAGASIYIADEQTRVLPLLLQDWLLENAITICFLPTPLAESILRLDWPREVALRILLTGGDKLHDYPLPSIPFELVNNYGPTENTVVTTSCSIPSGQQTDTAPSIGRPISNTQVYVLDADRKPVPIGVSGELYIGGDGLARGYLNRPDLTNEKFIPNPFSNQSGERLYKTGDLARYLPDGNIEFLGRIDNQVKIRGFRIELGEIEAVLTQHPNVREALVIDREDISGNKSLVAYIVSNLIPDRLPYQTQCQLELGSNLLKLQTEDISKGGVGVVGIPTDSEGKHVRLNLLLPGESEARWLDGTVSWSRFERGGIQFNLTPTEKALIEQSVDHLLETQGLLKTLQRTLTKTLRDYLKQKLPDYMIPSAFVVMKALPLTPNGKVDRHALPAPDNSFRESEKKFIGPRTPIETKLAAIWAEVLGLQQISINDNFFELGGHSLLAVQIISRIRGIFAIDIPLSCLFEAPTIAALSQAVIATQEIQVLDRVKTLSKIVPAPRDAAIPLSFSQYSMWYAEQHLAGVCAGNSPLALQLTGSLSPAILEQSLNEIISRHESLRTNFPTVAGQPVQQISPFLTVPLEVINLQHLPLAIREPEAQKILSEVMNHHFDLTVAPLIKTVLIQLSPEEHWLLIVMHHIITDGWSYNVLLEELETLYCAFLAGEPSPLPQLPFQYADFAIWEHNYFSEEVLASHLPYWQQHLANLATSLDLLPVAQSLQDNHSAPIDEVALPQELTNAIASLSQTHSVTPFMVLLTALNILLYKWSNQTDILILGTMANRTTPDIEKMIGCFISDLPLRTQLDPYQTGISLLEKVKQIVSATLTHAIPQEKVWEPFEDKIEFLRIVNLVLVPAMKCSSKTLKYNSLPLTFSRSTWNEQEVPLELYVTYPTEENQTINICASYSTKTFNYETVRKFISSYQAVLQKLTESPETPLAQF